MTGFGAHQMPLIINDKTVASVYVELRSINSRFLDLVFRSPDEVKTSESQIREHVAKRIARGKIECRIHILRGTDHDQKVEASDSKEDVKKLFQAKVLNDLKHFEAFIKQEFPQSQALSVKDILTWPGLIKQEEIGSEQLHELILKTLDIALGNLVESRKVEGQALQNVILQCVEKMSAIVAQIEIKLPIIIQTYQDKLTEKLLSVLEGVDQQGRSITKEELVDRIKQEVLMYGVRIDVAEEINRLKTHFEAVKSALSKGGPVGKRLDFLMQELQRESNTLGSKSVSQETSDASMELKLLVEQIREQVQNLE
jgi:uncharacterized protein (TIGR00255 family)